MDRKGQILGETSALLITTIVIIILLAVFYFFAGIMSPAKAEQAEAAASLAANNTVFFEAYLNTPATVDGQEIKMSDLLMIAKINSSYKPLLESKTKDIFDDVYGTGYQFWIIQESQAMLEINPLTAGKYGWVRTQVSLPEEIVIYLQLAKGQNEQ